MVHEAKCSYWKIALTVAALLSVFTQHATGNIIVILFSAGISYYYFHRQYCAL